MEQIIFWLGVAIFILMAAVIGLLIDRKILTKKVLQAAVTETATAVVQEVEKIFSPDELTLPALQADFADLKAKIVQAEKALTAEMAGIQAQALATQNEVAQLIQLKAVLGATTIAPAAASAAPAPDAAATVQAPVMASSP